MKERPILFSAEMVRAILDGRKTQTRRIVKPQPRLGRYGPSHPTHPNGEIGRIPGAWGGGSYHVWRAMPDHDVPLVAGSEWAIERFNPYGAPGDRLWVKEKWRPSVAHGCAGGVCDCGDVTVRYAADSTDRYICDGKIGPDWTFPKAAKRGQYVSSLFMPRWASRITLEIVSVRVERVQEISEADAIAEGFTSDVCEDVFSLAARGVREMERHYITDADGGDLGQEWCYPCAEKVLRKRKYKNARIHYETGESDRPAWCETCGVVLTGCGLTDYGIERELFLGSDSAEDVPHYAAHGSDAVIARDFARNVPARHLGRLAKVGFATCIDLLHGRGTWRKNEWVWVIEFKRVEAKR